MKRRNKKKRKGLRLIRLWDKDQADKALPLLRSITSSLREHWLEAHMRKQELLRLGKKPGRPDRSLLLAQEEAGKEQEKAQDRFEAALEELMSMDVFLLDPVRGISLVPFGKEEELAWYVFDLFEEQGYSAWRYHRDPIETRRPLEEADEKSTKA